MNRGVLLTLVLALAAGGLGLWAGRSLSPSSPNPERTGDPAHGAPTSLAVGSPLPAVELLDTSGRRRSLSQWRGRPLLINFWASWCAPCVEEMPLLDAFAAREAENGVQVVGIALDDPAAVERFLDATPVAYPILLDRVGPNDSSVQVGNALGVLPYSVLVDASGRVLAQKHGPFRGAELARWTAPAR